MKKMRDEFDVLLPSVDPLEGELTRDLLEQEGIPSMLHGPDFDKAELGLLVLAQRGDLNALSDAEVGQPETERNARRPWLDKSVLLVLLAIFGTFLVLLYLNAF